MVRFAVRPLMRALVLAALMGATVSIVSADNIDQNNNGAHYAWGENVGWLSARPSGEAYAPGGSGVQVSDTGLTGYLWGENVGWISLSCMNNAACGGPAGNWGVKNDGAGVLSGYAWGENVGWISFSCNNNPSTCAGTNNYGVTITNYGVATEHADSGYFTGYAWGENIGWINFNCSNDASCGTVDFKVQTGAPDTDGDGYTDAQESQLGKDAFTYCDVMREDVDGDGQVTIVDMALVAQQFLAFVPPASARLDQDADAQLTIVDLGLMAQDFLALVSVCP